MSEPKRYAILGVVVEPSYNAEEVTSEMIAVPNGAWVRHDDYARLQALTVEMDKTINASQAECRRLQAEVEALMTNPTSRLLRAEREENARLKAEVERLTKDYDTIFKDRALLWASHKIALQDIQGLHYALQTAKGVQS